MTAAQLKLIAPIDAFRLVLRDQYPINIELSDQITSIRWFHYSADKPEEDVRAAWRALDTIKGFVAAGNIRVHGIEVPNPHHVEIDPVDLAGGELDIWKQELDCSIPNVRALIYRNVYFLDNDIRQLVGDGAKRRTGRRPAADWDGVVKQHLFGLLDHHGLPSPEDPEWSTQADAERAVADFCASKGWDPTESVVRDHTRKLLEQYRITKAGN